MTRSLSIHAHYRCQHSGACCTSGWPIPVEADRLARIRAAIATGILQPGGTRGVDSAFMTSVDAPPQSPAILGMIGDRCVFYDADAKRCGIHRALDHEALPLACRQFPRVSLHDPRGTSITLSHYCPTAAAMLNAKGPITILEGPQGFPVDGEYVGLEATSSLPPLLRPDMLMDWESWWEWERLSVDVLSRDKAALTAVRRLSKALEHARSWTPDDGPLISRVQAAFTRARRSRARAEPWSRAELQRRRDEIFDAIPATLRPSVPLKKQRGTEPSSTAVLRLLAAHAFANWTALLGRGLRTWLRSVEAPLALIQSGLDVRTVDLCLRHLAEPKVLAQVWSEAESIPPP